MTPPGWTVPRLPLLWLAIFFLAPLAVLVVISLSVRMDGIPPVASIAEWVGGRELFLRLNLGNYALILADPLYLDAFLTSLGFAAATAAICLVVGFPMAMVIARAAPAWRAVLLMLVVLPFWTSSLIRIYAWIGVLQHGGPLNTVLLWLGLIDQPLTLLASEPAVLIGLVYSYLPFMILPLYARLERQDPDLLAAAADLGCGPLGAFLRVTWPIALPGVIAGVLLVFVPVVGEFVIPDLLGGPQTVMIGGVVWTEFFQNRDWPVASALALTVLAILLLPILALSRPGRSS